MPKAAEIAIVSLGTTMGLRAADATLADLLGEAGAECEVVQVRVGSLGGLRRGMLLTDLVEAYASRRSARAVRAPFVIYSSITSSLLQGRGGAYAVRFDALAAQNRPGPGGAWQRRRERAVLHSARLLLPWNEEGARAADRLLGAGPPSIVLPPPVDAAPAGHERDIDAVAYAGNPDKRGLDLLCEAWQQAAGADRRLVIAGLDSEAGRRYLGRAGVAEPSGVEWAGRLPQERWLALLRRACVFVNASKHEDWGLAQMEALAAGTLLVTVPCGGSGEPLALAKRLAPRLVAPERTAAALAAVLRLALALDATRRREYEREASALLVPYRRSAVRGIVAERVLPALRHAAGRDERRGPQLM